MTSERDYREPPCTPADPPDNVIAFPKAPTGVHGLERYLTKRDLADLLGVSVGFVDTHMRESGLPYHKVGRSVRFKLSEVEKWIERRPSGR